MMLRKLVVCLSLFCATGAMALDQDQAEKAYEVRHSVFELVLWNVGPLAGMVKEQIPFDAERARLNADRIAFLLTLIPDAFATDTRGFELETEAKDVIWQEKDEFLTLADAVAEKSRALQAATETGDFGEVSAAFVEMGQACKDCHDRYRED